MKFISADRYKVQAMQKQLEQLLEKKSKVTYSKYKIMKALVARGIWSDFKTWIANMQYQDYWDVPLEFEEDDKMFQVGAKAFQSKFQLSDDEMNTLKEGCRN